MERTTEGTVIENLRKSYSDLSVSEKKIADYILKYPDRAVNCNVSELANASGTSDATIIRFSKHLGYSGYYQLRIILSRELGRIDRPYDSGNSGDTIAGTLQKYAANLQYLAGSIDESRFQKCVQVLEQSHYVHIVAAGNTTPLAHHLGFRLGRLGIRSTFHMLTEYYMNDVILAQENDVIFAISQSGSSKQVVQVLEIAAQRKIPIIAMVGYEYSPISKLADYLLPAVVPNQSFDYCKNHAHIYEMAVLDALLDVIASSREKHQGDAGMDLQEMLLSDTKL